MPKTKPPEQSPAERLADQILDTLFVDEDSVEFEAAASQFVAAGKPEIFIAITIAKRLGSISDHLGDISKHLEIMKSTTQIENRGR